MNKKRVVVISLIALFVVAGTSIGTTVAWFSNGNWARIEHAKITLKTEPDIWISTSKDGKFKDELTKEELLQVEQFKPVTSMYSEKWISDKSDKPLFTYDFNHVLDGDTPTYTTSNLYSQEIYFKSNDNVYVTLDSSKVSFSADEAKNKEVYEKMKADHPEMSIEGLNNLYKSLRVSVLYKDDTTYSYVIYDPYKESDTLFAGALDADHNGVFDFDSYTNKEIMYGDYHGDQFITYDEASSKDVPYVGKLTCFNSGHRANIAQLNLQKSIEAGLQVGVEKSESKETIEKALSIPVRDDVATKVYINLYFEGWDLDNTILTQYGYFNVNLGFKIKGEILK